MWFCALILLTYHAVSSATKKIYGGNHMKEKNTYYKDFSNRKPYNDIPCKQEKY